MFFTNQLLNLINLKNLKNIKHFSNFNENPLFFNNFFIFNNFTRKLFFQLKHKIFFFNFFVKKSFNFFFIKFKPSNLLKLYNFFSFNQININFLRKNKIFNKGRYSRNRQYYRTGVYWCLYINIIVVLGFFFWFFKLTFNFGYLWWLLYSFFFACIFSKFFNLFSYNFFFKDISLTFYWFLNLLKINFFSSFLKTFFFFNYVY